MNTCLFLGDSITDAGHLFDPANLGNGYVSLLARRPEMHGCTLCNRGHDGFTIERIWKMLERDGLEDTWDVITLLAGVNDVTVEVYTSRPRIPQEFTAYYEQVLRYLTDHTRARLFLAEPFLFDSPAEYIRWRPLIRQESLIIQKLAKKYHARFLPTDQLLRSAAKKQGMDQITLDGIHLTPEGNRILADIWLSAYLDEMQPSQSSFFGF
ncbi:MAG: hypothetical protein KH828_01275 [Clostridiales bacterium]|nr:hypothetical protein [Clostridiales bacterium]